MSRTLLHRLGWLAAGLVLGVLVAVSLVGLVTQTRWGHAKVLQITLKAVAPHVHGTLTVQRLDGNLLLGARLYGVSLTGPEGEPFITSDSAFVEYNLRTLAGGDVALRRIVLYHPDVVVRQLPGDSLWNFEKIFPPTPGPSTRRSALLLESAKAIDARVLVEMPWEPDTTASAAEQHRRIEEVLSDSSEVVVRRVTGGFVRSMGFRLPEARFANAVFGPDTRGGWYARILQLRGEAFVYREPAVIEHANGEFAMRYHRVEFRADTLQLPRSKFFVAGVVHTGDTLRYDIDVRTDSAAFDDVRWIYPRFPESGGGALRLRFETRPEGTLVLADSMRLHAPGTKVRGSFGLILGDTLHFVDVDLKADPLRVATIEAMLPEKLPVRGLHIGALEVRGAPAPPARAAPAPKTVARRTAPATVATTSSGETP